ncbi:MAG: hypothetical protein ACNI27_13745 [Desulfovibrio sp.]
MSDREEQRNNEENLFPPDVEENLRKLFAPITNEVQLEIFTEEGKNPEFTDFALNFSRALARVSEHITVQEFPTNSARAAELNIEAAPTIAIAPDRLNIRFLGAPAGEESRAYIEMLLLAGTNQSGLGKLSLQMLDGLTEPRSVKVFTSPT